MGRIKDSLHVNSSKSFTLTEEDLEYLTSMHNMFQKWIDNLQQASASEYLHNIAVHRFGYAPLSELQFSLDPTKKDNNLQIVNIHK